jgi:hypothetical protein
MQTGGKKISRKSEAFDDAGGMIGFADGQQITVNPQASSSSPR